MIHVAARATNGVVVPNRKVTRAEIIDLFKKQLSHLRERLNVGGFKYPSRFYSYLLICRASPLRGRLALPVMGGRLRIQMDTLLSRGTG